MTKHCMSEDIEEAEQSKANALLENERTAALAQEADRHKLELTLNSCAYLDTELELEGLDCWNKAKYARSATANDLRARLAVLRDFLTKPEASP
jgi:hypothetical protein